MKNKLNPHLGKHLLVTNVFVLLGMLVYNLASLWLPIVRIRLGGLIIILLVLNACLVTIKLVNNFDFSAYR